MWLPAVWRAVVAAATATTDFRLRGRGADAPAAETRGHRGLTADTRQRQVLRSRK